MKFRCSVKHICSNLTWILAKVLKNPGPIYWQNQNSFAYLKELLQNVLKAFDLPIVFHAINIIDKMPLKESRLKNGLVLDHTNYIYFSKSVHDQEIINSLTKLIGLVSIQNDKK